MINIPGEHRDIYCEKCRKVTDHVSCSYSEKKSALSKIPGIGPALDFIGGKVADSFPITPLCQPFRCTKCNWASLK